MFGSGPGNATFDAPFFVLELALMAVWLIALVTVRWQRALPWRRGAALGLAIAGGLVLPAIWNVVFSPAVGFERGARAVIGAPCVLINGLLSSLWAVASAADAIRPKLPAARPFLVTAGLGLLLWLLFWT
ncbi:MAG TPA: hypothetical protein VE987_03380 [Polyangiaceae bacterium]|nr:hypothetical protein [Polyangiaceae bacterium]